MATPLRVLIVEDNPDDATLVMDALRQAGFAPTWQRVETEADYLAQLPAGYEVILADYTLPRFGVVRALQLLQERGLDIPFIVVTGTIGEEKAVECIKHGATDYLLKDRLARLGSAVTQALREKTLRAERQRAENTLREEMQIALGLARVGQELITSLATPTILDRLCQLTTEVLQCEYSHTLLWQPRDEVYVPVAGWGTTSEQWETLRVLKIPRAGLADVLVRLVDDGVVQQDSSGTQDVLSPLLRQRLGISRCLWMALQRGTEIDGIQIASLRDAHQRVFSPEQERLARRMAHLASLVLNNARLLEQAEEASRLKSDFLATMSHELRSPLHVIMGYTDLLLEGDFGLLTPAQQQIVQRVDRSAQNLLDPITAMLDVGRLDAGRLPVQMEMVDLPALVAELQREMEEEGRAKGGVRLEWRIAPELPVLHTDKTKVKIVLKNLLQNGVKFTDAGSVTLAVASREHGVEFAVSDTGIGIAADLMPIMFDMFRQGDSSTTRRHEGIGLGLYIVKRMLELLGGTVTVESEVGRGSTFRVCVPTDVA